MDFGKISRAFVDAALDPSRWNAAMETATAETRSVGALMLPYRGRLPNVPHTQSLLQAFAVYVREGWIHRDDRYLAMPAMLRKGVATEFDFTTADAIRRRPYYQEFLAPLGLRWFACVKVTSGHDVFFVSLQRTIQQGPFSSEEVANLATLSTELAGAGAMASALGFARAEGVLEAFQASATAALLTDREGKVFRTNAAAEALFGPDLQIRNGRLIAANAEDHAALERALHVLLWQSSDSCLTSPILLRRTGKRPIVAYLLRLESLARDIIAPARAAIVLVDLEQRPVPAEAVLRQIFRLTAAEARLVVCIAGGKSLAEAAEILTVSYDTARTQLKRAFSKTDTSRQTDLIALVARLSLPIGRLV